MMNIKGKEIPEDIIIEALKKYCVFEGEPPLKAGDIVCGVNGIRIIVECCNGKLTAHDLSGEYQMNESDFGSVYTRIGRLDILLNIPMLG